MFPMSDVSVVQELISYDRFSVSDPYGHSFLDSGEWSGVLNSCADSFRPTVVEFGFQPESESYKEAKTDLDEIEDEARANGGVIPTPRTIAAAKRVLYAVRHHDGLIAYPFDDGCIGVDVVSMLSKANRVAVIIDESGSAICMVRTPRVQGQLNFTTTTESELAEVVDTLAQSMGRL